MIKRVIMFKHLPPGIIFRLYKDIENLFYKVREPQEWVKCEHCGETLVWNTRNIETDGLVHVCPTESVYPVYDGSTRDTAFPEYLQGDTATEFMKNGFCDMCLKHAKEWAEPDRYGNVQVYGEYHSSGDLLGFLCPDCIRKREAAYGE